MPAGLGRVLRLDPPTLPVRITMPDAVADGRVRLVEIDRDRVLVSRSVRGMAIRLRLPIATYLGVTARVLTDAASATDKVALRLEHRDPALSVDLVTAAESTEAAAEWRRWADALGLPLLVSDQAGRLHTPLCEHLDARKPTPRRRRRNAIKNRRPRFLLRRRAGVPAANPLVHHEREIIARN
jgi:hypothetical protein